jgi:hypothetical protein
MNGVAEERIEEEMNIIWIEIYDMEHMLNNYSYCRVTSGVRLDPRKVSTPVTPLSLWRVQGFSSQRRKRWK